MCLILAITSFPFMSRLSCSWWSLTFLIFHVNTQLKDHMTFWVGLLHPDSAPYQVLGALGLVIVEIKGFRFVTWPHDRCVTWLCGLGSLILSHHSARFGVYRLCESGTTTFLFVTWSRYWRVTWLFGWVSFILSHQPAKFGFHKLCESGDITFLICHVTRILKCHVTLWMESPQPKSSPC